MSVGAHGLFGLILTSKYVCLGRGTVVSGKLEHGIVRKGDEAVIMGFGKSFKTTVTGKLTLQVCDSKLCAFVSCLRYIRVS